MRVISPIAGKCLKPARLLPPIINFMDLLETELVLYNLNILKVILYFRASHIIVAGNGHQHNKISESDVQLYCC